MKPSDYAWLALLFTTGAWLWEREARQTALALADTLPLLLAFPLFWRLGAPWTFRTDSPPFPWPAVAGALLLGAAGCAAGSGLLTALGWAAALGAWLLSRTSPAHRLVRTRLLLLPLLGFPWLVGAAGGLGWWFRLSAAWVSEKCFAASGFEIIRLGTLLTVRGEPLSVEAACAGLGSLQAMLLAGAAAAALELGKSPRFWFCLPVLFLAAWLANTLRVLLLSATALSAGHEFASGSFHGLLGWAVLVAVFQGCLLLFRSWVRRPAPLQFSCQPAPS